MKELEFNQEEWLKNMVAAVKTSYKETEYWWPLQRGKKRNDSLNEAETVNLFNNISKEFSKYDFKEKDISNIDFSKDIKDSDLIPIFNVIVWGGTYRAKKKEDRNKAVFKINNNLAEIKKYTFCKDFLGDTIRKIACNMNNGMGISTWSKILAAYKPGTFFIYDSRVAIALIFIALKSKSNLPCFWKIPKYYIAKQDGTAIEKMNKAIAACRKNNPNSEIADDPTCYDRYLKLLRTLAEDSDIRNDYKERNDNVLNDEIKNAYNTAFEHIIDNKERKTASIMAHMEKMLFMMKEGIVDDIKKGKWL